MMTPNNSYLLRAFFDWILDNGMTPHIVVNAEVPGTNVPESYVSEGKIILNINPKATSNLILGKEHVEFSARFNGQMTPCYIPMGAIMAVYARETGLGHQFPPITISDYDLAQRTMDEKTEASKPQFKVVEKVNSDETKDKPKNKKDDNKGKPDLRVV